MKIPTLLKLCQRNLVRASKPHLQQDAGFNMVELVIGMLVIAILSSIAAPGWLAFINNQRLRTAQSGVYGALQLAQSSAKRDKVSWQASFRTQGNLVQWAIHPTTTDPTTLPVSTSNSSAPNVWYSFQEKIAIAPSSDTYSTTTLPLVSGIYKAIFNRQGCLVDDAAKECTDAVATGFTLPQRIVLKHDDLGPSRKCAVVTTLLGSIKTGDDAASCNLIPPP